MFLNIDDKINMMKLKNDRIGEYFVITTGVNECQRKKCNSNRFKVYTDKPLLENKMICEKCGLKQRRNENGE
jgi:hypothetical protein